MKLFATLVLLATALSTEAATGFTKAHIYFIPWYVVTRSAMQPNEVRAGAHKSVVLTDTREIAQFMAILPTTKMSKDLDYAVYDVRLVVDLERGEEKETFIASRLAVSDERTPETNARIDEAVRAGIESWIEKRANQALVPTPMSVTPAADAPVAPATGAAHL